MEKYVKTELEALLAKSMGDGDVLYNRVIVKMIRLIKVLTGHSSAIDSLERKLGQISAPKKKKAAIISTLKQITAGNLTSQSHMNSVRQSKATKNNLSLLDEGIGGDVNDDEGLVELEEPAPEYQDEIDIPSEGALEREIMMDHIKMVEIEEMENYKKYNLRMDDQSQLKLNESDEIEGVSSESGSISDKDDGEGA